MEDSYVQEMDATILDILPEGEKRWRMTLDKTVFYPMGGGQPTDQGELISDTWKGKVYQVLTRDGEIWHYVESDSQPAIGTSVHGKIDWSRRYQNMRMHSAGHVIDFALHLLGYSPSPLSPQKGDHGKKPFIMYAGTLGKDIRQELEEKSNELVAKAMTLTTAFVPLEELEKDAIYLQPGLPTGKPLRKLTLIGVGSVADGGTQVKNTKEIGNISILSASEENESTIITYKVA
jgi:alanyl-tRNA synthetase